MPEFSFNPVILIDDAGDIPSYLIPEESSNEGTNPEVSLTTEPELLTEADETQASLNFTLSEPPPLKGITLTIDAPNLDDFNLSQIQTQGGEIALEAELVEQLNTNLDDTRADEVPGAAVAVVSPSGSWFGASGVANVEDNTPLQPDDRFEIGSITKTFTATVILQLVEEEVLNLDDNLTDWLPEDVTVNIPNADEITLEQLLQHTSGIADYVDVLFTEAASNPLLFARDWQPEELVDLIDGQSALSEPGESFYYSNTNNDNYSSYGLGVGTIESPNRFWYIHRGQTLGYRSNMWYSPQDDLTYIELINGFSTDNLVRDILPTYREGINDSVLEFSITESEASISIPVLDDGETELEETASFSLELGDGYEVDPENSAGEFTISDNSDTTTPEVSTPSEPTKPETDNIESIFGSTDNDTIEVEGDNELVFAGDSSDLIDASRSEGNNHIYAGNGNDTLILGESDRILAGAGDDALFTSSGGNNVLTGGAGADQFWIASAELPESANIITDFTSGEDLIGVVGLGISYDDLNITDTDAGVLVATNSANLALFIDRSLDAIALEDNFAFS